MKRFMIATALTATMATAGFAATEAEMAEINSYVPNADVSMMSDEQVAQAMQIINSGEGRGDKVSQLNALLMTPEMSGPAVLSEAEMVRLQEAAPNVDLTAVTQAQASQALQVLSSGDGSDRNEQVVAILMGESMETSGMAMPTEAEMVQLERYISTAEVQSLTQTELAQAMQILTSGDSEGDKQAKLNGLVN
ncbi:hypothetical protein [Thalassococcus profundi]|jgi:hypothetical protein|nr:hypothetical protein [Thalassococcus profundi]